MIKLQNLRKDYVVNKKAVTALKRIDITIEQGEIFGVIGHSGAGKSTLIRCINLLERPTQGSVIIDGVDLTTLSKRELQKARQDIGMIFQHFNLISSSTIFENVAFPLRLAKKSKAEVDSRVNELLKLVGLSEHAKKYPSQLSGGQKQRVGIARALANDPKVLLCDEATSALDPMTTQSILRLLADINRKTGITIILITHEMQVIQEICDRVAVIDNGEIVEAGKVAEVFLRPQQEITQEFVAQVSHFEWSDGLLRQNFSSQATGKETRCIVRVTFLGEVTFQPIMFEVLQRESVAFNILHGTISRMKDTPYGQLVLELSGIRADVDRAVATMQARGLDVEVIG